MLRVIEPVEISFTIADVSTKAEGFEKVFKKKADLFVAAADDGAIRKVIIGAREKKPILQSSQSARRITLRGPFASRALHRSLAEKHAIPFDLGAAGGSWDATSFIESFGVGLSYSVSSLLQTKTSRRVRRYKPPSCPAKEAGCRCDR
jgi:predicted RNA-binding Zn ribbon-like protein